MKYSLGISNFLEEISSLSHSIVFLYFFALTAKEGFLISPCYCLELCIQMGICFLFSFSFASLLFSAVCKGCSDNHFAFLHFFFLAWFSCSSVGKESACSAGDPGSIPGLGRSPGEGTGNPLQYPRLENLWTEEPDALQSMGSERAGHNWVTNTY